MLDREVPYEVHYLKVRDFVFHASIIHICPKSAIGNFQQKTVDIQAGNVYRFIRDNIQILLIIRFLQQLPRLRYLAVG